MRVLIHLLFNFDRTDIYLIIFDIDVAAMRQRWRSFDDQLRDGDIGNYYAISELAPSAP